MADANEFILKKIDQIETRLESHVSKIEQRLDQIVSIMQAVAKLQEKETHNSDDIKEVKEGLRDSIDNFSKAVIRIHERLDKIDKENDKEKIETLMAIDGKINDKVRIVNDINDKIDRVNVKVDKWLNRGIGIWIGVSVLVVVLQTVGGFVLASVNEEYKSFRIQVTEAERKQSLIEQEISRINSKINSK